MQQPEASQQRSILEALIRWRDTEQLRPLDLALARFLADEGGETDETVLLLAALASQQLGHGHICLDLDHLLADPDALFTSEAAETEMGPRPGELLAGTTTVSLTEALAQSPAVDTGEGNTPLVLTGQRLYLRRYWQYEQTVADQLSRKLAHETQPPANLRARLETLFDAPGEQTDWQKVACALATRSALTVITGGPGTGKTTTVVKLLGLLQSGAMENHRPLRIRLAAPTGKAAARLSGSIGAAVEALPFAASVKNEIPTEPTTLHRLLGRRPDSRHFRHHQHNPLHADLVVVDEASMIDLELMAGLLDALRPETRLVLLGDKDQLASVDAGAVLGDLCRDADRGGYDETTCAWVEEQTGESIDAFAGDGGALAQQTAMLRHNWRFRDAPGIGELAAAVNAGDPAAARAVWQAEHGDLEQITLAGPRDRRLARTAVAGYSPYLQTLRNERPASIDTEANDAWAKKVLDAFTGFQLLCALRQGPAGAEGLNTLIAEALHQAGEIERAEGWYEGRPVMLTRNDYQLGLMNGDVGITLNVPDPDGAASRLRVAFPLPDGRIRMVLPSRLDAVETVYAMTVHKSQGSEFDHTALVLPGMDNPVLTRELLYTAITRAKKRFTLLRPNPAVVENAIARPTWRASGLAEQL